MPPDEATPSALEQKLASLPVAPGCYLFKDKHGAVLHVGKAKSLRSRVRSYFQDGSSDVRAFIPFLRKHVQDLETIVTATEKEAAILENSLIKERKPRYNFKLRASQEWGSWTHTLSYFWASSTTLTRDYYDTTWNVEDCAKNKNLTADQCKVGTYNRLDYNLAWRPTKVSGSGILAMTVPLLSTRPRDQTSEAGARSRMRLTSAVGRIAAVSA